MTQTPSEDAIETVNNAGILIIGAELLSGKIVDENGPFMIQKLRERGIQVGELRIIDDEIEIIADAVRTFSQRFDRVMTTGGIGPTHDDKTIAAIAQAFGTSVTHHPLLVRRLQQRFGASDQSRLGLAKVPVGAEVILAEDRFLPRVTMRNVLILPGIPIFMRSIFSEAIQTWQGPPFFQRSLEVRDSETQIAASLAELQEQFPNVAIGSYPKQQDKTWTVTITLDSRDQTRLNKAYRALVSILKP